MIGIYKKERIKYYDLLRTLAIFGVIISHVFLIFPNAEVMHFKIVSFRQVFMYAVPLFLMISGALLLNRDIEIKEFFKKRLSRIITPFVFYMIVHVIVLCFVLTLFFDFKLISCYLALVPFEYNWYFWLILGIYITVPVINKFVQHSSLKEIEYFIAVLFLGSIFYQIMFILNITHYVNLNLVLCPVAYLVLGYYLSVRDFDMSPNKIIAISILLFIAITAIKVLSVDGYLPFEYVTGYDITTSPRVATKVDLGIFELIRVSSLFLMVRYLFESKSGIGKKIRNVFENSSIVNAYTSISRASYGMYLVNRTVLIPVELMVATMALSGTRTCIFILILMVAANLIAYIVVIIFNRIPFIKRFSGYH
ncbi:acyltransferase [uncultured Methanobrevibacter sp.]|uniref:acyltransferase n=1 Tax=uncultured Methanobrevibacter sp. TaxID=253161 RepID=UPI00261AFDCD|nr:acyltransferase [uncultured Methanobrevibacter sp.]